MTNGNHIITNFGFNESAAKSKDMLRRVYESRTFVALLPKPLSDDLRVPKLPN